MNNYNVRKAIYQQLLTLSATYAPNDLQIFFPNRTTGSDFSEDKQDQHLRVSILPVSELLIIVDLHLYTPKNTGDLDIQTKVTDIKNTFGMGTALAFGGNSFSVKSSPQESNSYISGGFYIQPLSFQIEQINC